MQQMLLAIRPHFLPTYKNYVVGSNALAVATIQQLQPGKAIYIWGDQGAGKTHLLKASTEHAGTLYLHEKSSTAHFDTARSGIARHIAIDNIDYFTEAQCAKVFYIYQLWKEFQHSDQAFSLLVSGSRPVSQLQQMREDLRTRLGWDLTFQLHMLSDEQKLIALQNVAQSLGIPIPVDALTWLLHHYDRNMAQLTGLLFELDYYSLTQQKPVSLPMLKELLQQKNHQRPYRSDQLTLIGAE